eukprot:1188785-Prorocentrum_minimum.AAC.1
MCGTTRCTLRSTSRAGTKWEAPVWNDARTCEATRRERHYRYITVTLVGMSRGCVRNYLGGQPNSPGVERLDVRAKPHQVVCLGRGRQRRWCVGVLLMTLVLDVIYWQWPVRAFSSCTPSAGVDGQKGLRLQFNSRQSTL